MDTGQWRHAVTLLVGTDKANQFKSLTDFVLSNPLDVLTKWMLRYIFDLPNYVASSFGWIGILGIAGMVIVAVRGWSELDDNGKQPERVLTLAIALFAVPLAITYFDRSYLLMVVPTLIGGLLYLLKMTEVENRRVLNSVILMLILFLGVVDLSRNLRYYYLEVYQTPDYEQVGRIVNQQIPSSTPILLIGQAHLAYYAAQSILLDCRSMEGFAKTTVGYVVVDSRYEGNIESCFSSVGISSSMLDLIFQTESSPHLTIYQISK